MGSEPPMSTHKILHMLRNPWGFSEEEMRQARYAACDLIERQGNRLVSLELTQQTAPDFE